MNTGASWHQGCDVMHIKGISNYKKSTGMYRLDWKVVCFAIYWQCQWALEQCPLVEDPLGEGATLPHREIMADNKL